MKTKTIAISSFIILLFCFACQQKQNDNSCEDLQGKIDSLTALHADFENSAMYKFYNILSKEKGESIDTSLIKEYTSLIGKDELVDLYIWDRIHTINTNTNKNNIIERFTGIYILKPNHNAKDAKVTSIRIQEDSCFIYKNKKLLKAEKLKFKNSSNKYINGKIIINNYRISLSDATHPKIATLDDNLCMDCEQLQFYKKK
ncbi:hypothetical protein H2O64_14370 [Kordia sp. YSTF-M3]|uniref:Lipoprotein n=1 Tax=Kordia aestuariivivens TaxID=2759037 RepID=A0ABR7QBD3_9FLAO|nr:hypothetical protein [Kordia aestuariivivens]MBC8755859.1 hypothetical protein [Kordia aestuariivivens]